MVAFVFALASVVAFVVPFGQQAGAAGRRPATVVSLGFDDGTADQFQAGALLRGERMQASFFVNSGLVGRTGWMSWEQLQTLAAAGNEIGGHTLDHAYLAALTRAQTRREICLDRRNLLQAGFVATDFAYPYGQRGRFGEQAVVACGYSSARTAGGLDAAACPGCEAESIGPLDVDATRALPSVMRTTSLSTLEGYLVRAERVGGWAQLVFHHICAGSACPPYSISKANLEALLRWLAHERAAGRLSIETVRGLLGTQRTEVTTGGPPISPNLLSNPSLELTGSGGLPNCWQPGRYGTSTAHLSRTRDAHTGLWAVSLTVTGFQSGDQKLVSAQTASCAPVARRQPYVLSAWYRSTVPVHFVMFLLGSQGWKTWLLSQDLRPGSRWQRAAWQTPPLPPRAQAISVGLAISANGTASFDDFGLCPCAPTNSTTSYFHHVTEPDLAKLRAKIKSEHPGPPGGE